MKLLEASLRSPRAKRKEKIMSTILLIVLILLLVSALPVWPHSRSWGYGGSGILGLLLILLIIGLLLHWF
jgi:hypothetical protein